MAKSEFLQLAHVLDPKKHPVAGRFMSEKLDGQRVFWDSGVSRGLRKADVPWANTDRDERYKKTQYATGLWTRYGNVIHAPDRFLDALPNILIDGELYAGLGDFQRLRSIVADLEPDEAEWQGVSLMAFDSPPAVTVFADRTINTTNYKKALRGCNTWYASRSNGPTTEPNQGFQSRLAFLRKHYGNVHHQEQLPFNTPQALARLNEYLEQVVSQGGEGVMLKSPSSTYDCERSYSLLKYKPYLDAEATVVGYVWGCLPDNTRTVSGDADGKLLGKMGALVCNFRGHEFKLSGFTDAERELRFHDCDRSGLYQYGVERAGQAVDTNTVKSPCFPLGSQVTFRYRELTDDGLPKEARYERHAQTQ